MSSIMKSVLTGLAAQGRANPENAIAEMRAVCDSAPGDPLTWSVTGSPGSQHEMTISQHPTVGGTGTAPCPGELVTMAIAACMDGSVRFFADLMEIHLERIHVEVVNRGDARWLLGIPEVAKAIEGSEPQDRGMQSDLGITMTVSLDAPGETAERLAELRAAAEGNSGVLNMMRHRTPVAVEWL